MPTILTIGPYRFHFYSRETGEPPHIHVGRDDFEAKFWIEPLALARNYGFPAHELNRLMELVSENRMALLKAWKDIHG